LKELRFVPVRRRDDVLRQGAMTFFVITREKRSAVLRLASKGKSENDIKYLRMCRVQNFL
jgi:hypothetical protein